MLGKWVIMPFILIVGLFKWSLLVYLESLNTRPVIEILTTILLLLYTAESGSQKKRNESSVPFDLLYPFDNFQGFVIGEVRSIALQVQYLLFTMLGEETTWKPFESLNYGISSV